MFTTIKLLLFLTSNLFATTLSFAPTESFGMLPTSTLAASTTKISLKNQKSRGGRSITTLPRSSMQSLLRSKTTSSSSLYISSGLTFDDGEQILVSIQKPLGVILEEYNHDNDDDNSNPGGGGGCFVADINPEGNASNGGVRVGDYLVAVQNMDCTKSTLEEVMDRIGNAPRVVNLRFRRRE